MGASRWDARQRETRPRPGPNARPAIASAWPWSGHRLSRYPSVQSRARPLSRRWLDTVATLVSLQAEYAHWLEALPEATRETATGEALQAMVDLDLEELVAIQPLLGFGRD